MGKCLIVDDSLVSRMMLGEIVKQNFSGYELLQAASGAAALETVEEQGEVDFAILDFNMPGMDGLELAEALKGTGKVKGMAMLTANVQDSVRARAEAMGLIFINKPIQEETVCAAINQLL